MESAELARWQRFATKGGIGRSTALVDCVAERDGDLMFLKDDEVTVLMQLPETGYYLGFCEGVVGRFAIADVQVHGKLKRAVMARRPASGASSPVGSPIASVSPTPSIPHTTYSPIRHPIDLLVANARAENSLTGVSSLLASPPISEPVLPDPEPETEPTPAKLISSSPPSSPLRVNTTTATTPSQRQSLNSLASTEASPLSNSSVYSFQRRNIDKDEDDEGGIIDEASQTDRVGEQDQDTEQNESVLSPRSPNTSNSRASSLSVDDPFHHDDPTGIPLVSSPSTPNHEDSHKDEDTDRRESVYSDASLRPNTANRGGIPRQTHLDVTDPESPTERTRIVSAALSDGEVGIGLTLLGGLLGAGRESMSSQSREDDDDGSESDYGHEEGYKPRAAAEPVDYEDDDVSLYKDGSFDDSHDTDRPGNQTLMDTQGDEAPLGQGSNTPIPNGHGRLSGSSTESRSSTPPFGFELDPTTVLPEPEPEGSTGEAVNRTSVVSTDQPRPVFTEGDNTSLRDEPQDDNTTSDDESDYGQPDPPNPTSPTSFISKQSSAIPGSEDDDGPMLPPVRPPYHRASSSMHSISSSNAGGYYDEGIYDHYRSSYVSMAARSMRFSIIGAGGEMPPLPTEHERVAPLNLQNSRPGAASISGSQPSPRSQGPMSPASQGPGSPSLHGPKSPLAQGEPASPRSMASGMSPLAAGPILQAQMEKTPEEEPSEPTPEPPATTPPATTFRLAPITTSGLAPSSPGTLTVPLSPTPSAPPSPALSANLASSLRQAIEQQRAESTEPGPPPYPESQDDAEEIDEDKPMLASPINLQGTFGGSPIASLQRRPSQFAPHPNAPKPVHQFTPAAPPPPGPAVPPEPATSQQTGVPHMRLHDALQLVTQRLRTGGVRTPTIHGRTHSELAFSSGPVLISFLFDPDGRSVPTASVSARVVGAQRSASMNVNTMAGSSGGGEYVGSRLRPRSRSFSGAPQEQMNELRSIREPSTPAPQPETRPHATATPATSSPLAHPSAAGSPATPVLTPITPNIPARVSESPVQSPSSPTNSSPVKRIASPPTNINSSGGSKGPFRGLRNVASNTMMRVGLGSISIPGSPVPKDHQPGDSPPLRQRQSNDVPRNVDTIDVHTPPSTSISASPMASSNMSLHSKVSLTGLKAARPNATTDTPTTPLSPGGSVQLAEETVHFHDMDFDMVKPKRRVSIVRTSEDGGYSGSRKSNQSDRPNGLPEEDGQASTPTSPVAASPSHQTRGSVPASLVPSSSGHNSLTSPAEIAAHVSREQRWISAMQTIPSSSVRKNKKIKKLLLEGVPASVRGVVWLYLTDSQARRMAGLYSQLGKRGKAAATPEILKDLESCFATQPHLQAPDGPVMSLLQAYLTMVPDITYSQSLCRIAGNLLMHSPEEDAFWTFVALMDNYLRGYCAVNSLQMEADSAFFAKSLESNDSQLAAKLFRELGLGAVDFCKPWILSAFVAAVPYEYGCRIWDVFLFEGAPFLFRIALVILNCMKKQIMTLTPKSSPGALACLLSISPQCLPSDPDQLIAAAYSVRFKEDDMRKARPKIEAQLRKESGLSRPVPVRDALKK
ncbi:hypothetical protein FRC12_003088 [Ceratobasidium sp. 428]|nr:hypothetical protein FRC12_003088 [Ceratobasidium sp. 428]